MKNNARFWWRWLIAVTIGVMLFGLVMIAAPSLTRQLFSSLVFSSSGHIAAFGDAAVSYIVFVHGVLGAVMFGWGVALLCILLGPFRRGSREAWLTLVVSLAAWLIPDTTLSLWSGFWQNAVLNVVLAVLFAVPLAATKNPCYEART